MSNAGAHAHAFYRQVATEGRIWTIRDSGGYPAPENSEGRRAQPFWSSLSRVKIITSQVPAYAGFEPVEIPWEIFRDRWLEGMKKDRLLVGVNWSGPRAVGFDIEPGVVCEAVEFQRRLNSSD